MSLPGTRREKERWRMNPTEKRVIQCREGRRGDKRKNYKEKETDVDTMTERYQ